ncbi:MAG: hypothetical protein FWG31_04575 [Oscillospiraceae bacterium]|nr:hypothetical protein [Oscillospiraceae bacterium]
MPSVIEHKAALILQLYDAASGRVLTDMAKFRINGIRAAPLRKDSGHHVFFGELPAEFTLEVEANTYQTRVLTVANPPEAEAFPVELLPSPSFHSCHTLEGGEKGLTAADMVRDGDNACLIRSFDERKRLLSLINPRKLALDRPRYAAVDPEKKTYQPVTIVKHISEESVKLDCRLTAEKPEQFILTPVIPGFVSPDGTYILRIRDAQAGRYIVRFAKGEKETFKVTEIP